MIPLTAQHQVWYDSHSHLPLTWPDPKDMYSMNGVLDLRTLPLPRNCDAVHLPWAVAQFPS